ncbi:NAD-dependent epimerase/dehydratase family protein [Primorskyibacter sp. 2E107]|uniref:NAD-dependent epimerase/dehydratase family protein n=1 Tax=Primorskyibacter sp. 2E107 TaxID=3403458 RepID=UPI003AF8AF36
MGDVSRILITGASGFVGGAAVRAARARGLSVIAQYRSLPHAAWQDDAGITPLRLDLTAPGAANALSEVMPQVDAIIHAAAHLGDDPVQHERLSIGGTRAVLSAMAGQDARFVLVSSIVVYDIMALKSGDTLDESSPTETPERARDPYTRAKLQQEAMVAEAVRSAWLIRPGAVWGEGRTWHALLGFWASKVFVQIGGNTGELPVVHVDHLAEMLVNAVQTAPTGLAALNALDDDRPNRARFMVAHRAQTGWPKFVVRVPYGLWFRLVGALRPLSGRLPGLFREPIVRARLMPLTYSNAALRAVLGGKDSARFEDMLARSVERRR